MLHAGEAQIDLDRALRMAVIHDLAEAITGDVATRVAELDDPGALSEKRTRESAAMAEITSPMDEPVARDIMDLWREYEQSDTDVARFVRDMNLIDMCLQAYIYERDRAYAGGSDYFPEFQGMDEFFATSLPRLSSPVARKLFEEVCDQYNQLPSVADRGGLRLTPIRSDAEGGGPR
jgi:putative hydrolase of HD superfamily